MGYNCAACTKSIRSSQLIKCSKCSSYYHLLCVNISDPKKLTEELKTSWLCPMCKAAEPRRDNTNTPVRVCVSGGDDATSATSVRAPVSPISSQVDSDSLSSLVAEIRLLREDVGEIKSQMKSLSEHITKCNARLDEYEKNLADSIDRLHVVEQRTSVIISLENTILQLREQQSARAQSQLRNDIEIAGVIETANENPMHTIRVIAQKIGMPLDDKDLDYVTRVGPLRRDSENSSKEDLPSKLPRPLVVRFLRRHQRDEFLKAGKSKTNLNCSDIGIDGSRSKIYFNERLTQEKRQLFRAARHLCKGSGFKYCWIKNGSLYVRKQEGNPAITIKNMDELFRYVDPTDREEPSH